MDIAQGKGREVDIEQDGEMKSGYYSGTTWTRTELLEQK